MKKKNVLTLIPFILAMGCMLLYKINGVTVAPDGTLQEAFYFIPLGYLCLFTGIIALLLQGILYGIHRKKNSVSTH